MKRTCRTVSACAHDAPLLRSGDGADLGVPAAHCYIGAATNRTAPDGYDVLEVAAHTWAAFAASGRFPDALDTLWRAVGGEWLPANPYELVPPPPLVRVDYHDDEGARADVELWLAVAPTSR